MVKAGKKKESVETQDAGAHKEGESNASLAKEFPSALSSFFIVVLSIFAVEMLVSYSLRWLPPMPEPLESFSGALLLTVLVFPLLYFLVFRRLMVHRALQECAEEELREGREGLEEKIEKRTEELSKTIALLREQISDRKKAETELEDSHERFLTVLDSLDAYIYVADMQTHEILFANKRLRDIRGDVTGKICWQVLQEGQSAPCDFCTNDKLLTSQGEPAGVYSWEFRNTVTGSWLDIRDRAIRWVDGRIARLEVAIDIIARKQAEEYLENARNYLDSITNSIHEGVLVIEKDLTISYANKAYLRQTGLKMEDVIGKTCFSASHGNDEKCRPPECDCPLDVVMETKFPQISVHKHSDKDGNERWVEISTSPILNSEGEVDRVVEVIRDISRRKQTEEALEVYASQQSAVAELGEQALAGKDLAKLMEAVVNLTAKCLDVEYCKILELLPDGKTLLLKAGVGWEDALIGRATVSADKDSQAGYTLLSKEPVVVEDLKTEKRFRGPPLLLKHGVVSGISVMVHGRERPYGVLGAHTAKKRKFTRDDTQFLQAVANILAEAIERLQAEEALKESEERFRSVAQSAVDAIILADSSGKIVFWNNGARELFGYTEDEVLGRALSDLMPDRYKEIHDARLELAGSTGDSKLTGKTFEVHGLRKDGSEFPLEISLSAWKRGAEMFFSGIIRDITERKSYEETLREMSIKDGLTGLYNYSYFHDRLGGEISRYKRNRRPLSLLMLDVDSFKEVNDTRGHLEGDNVLITVAQIIQVHVRGGIDTVVRYGGDEFAVVLPETRAKEAERIAQRIRKATRATRFDREAETYNITISIGVSSITDLPEDIEVTEKIKDLLVDYADKALYNCKSKGGDLVKIYDPQVV
jgi:diguanylate cyclase (GGDEF)-like protein/PAS domain S-box-containing protein